MSSLHDARIIDLEPVATIAIRDVVPMDGIAAFFDRAFPALAGALASQGLTPLGAPYARYWGNPTEVADIEVGFPVSGTPVDDDDVRASDLPGGRVATATLRGSYEGLGAAWQSLYEWVTAQGEAVAPSMWEVYVTEPSPEKDPNELVTELYWPLAG